jgi:hypothetical protein
VIYDSTAPAGTGEGVYIKAKAYELTDEKEIAEGLKCLDIRENKEKKHTPQQFLGSMPRRIYKAAPEKVWMNEDSDKDGNFIDIRIEVPLLK